MEVIRGLSIIPLLLVGCMGTHRTSSDQKVRIDDIKIYADFDKRGYTIASAFTHFDDLSKEYTKQSTISHEQKEKLEKVLNAAEKRKQYQTKLGTDNIFCEIKFFNHSTVHRVVISDVGIAYENGFRKGGKVFLTDLTDMVYYKITSREDMQWLFEFVKRLKSE